jgi:hypothetical protein
MLGVEVGPEVTFNQLGGPGGGPQLGAPAVGLGPLQEQPLEFLQLLRAQSGLGAGVRPGGEGPQGLPGELDPGVDGGAPTPEESGDLVGGFALLDEFDGPEAATLEFFSGPNRSQILNTSGTGGLFGWLGWSQ